MGSLINLYTFAFFLFTFSINLNCQNVLVNDSLLNKYKLNSEFDSLAELAFKNSVYYYRKNNLKKAIEYGNIEVDTRKKLSNTSLYKRSLYNQALLLQKDMQYFKSIKVCEKIIKIFDQDKLTYKIYTILGGLHKKTGNYYEAENYYKKGIFQPNIFNNKELYRVYLNTALLYDYIETKESLCKEFFLLQKTDSINKLLKFTNKRYYSLNFAFGNYFKNDKTFNFKKSKKYFLKVLQKSSINKDSLTFIKACINYADLLNKTKKDSAYIYINKGISLIKNEKNLSLPKLYYQLSEFYINKESFRFALNSINKSLKLVVQNKNIVNDSLINKSFSFSNKKTLLFYLIKHKAAILLRFYKKTNNNKPLVSALKYIFHADKLLDLIKQESIETKSKLFWQQEASEIYLQGVKASLTLNKPEDAFYFMEKNKALLLLENISEIQIRKQVNIPVSILEKELELKQQINSLENRLNENPKEKDSLENEYYSTKIKLNEFVQSLKKEHPTYYNYKKPIEISKLIDIQASLDKNTMVLEYILDENEGYLMAITKENSTLHKLDSIKNITKKINIYLGLISRPLSTKEKRDNYSIIAHELYNSLFPFPKNKLTRDITKLIVIPDYTLQNIPFESLKNSNGYLINDYEISYAYSLSFLDQNRTTKSPKKRFIGFAPYNFTYDNLTPLKNSKKEILNTTNYFLGDLFTDSLATKQRFINSIENYNIIHLATHATASDSISPWIAFKNKKLHLNELYTLKTNADLVVLSACKTSLGKIKKGEGVFSLARGFFYSGSKSVISTLWNVNDKSSQEILSDFYENIKGEKTKSEALRQAKLNYINTHQLSEQSPYYWSSFVLIGDTTAISIDSTSEYYPYIFVLFLVAIGFILYRKRTK